MAALGQENESKSHHVFENKAPVWADGIARSDLPITKNLVGGWHARVLRVAQIRANMAAFGQKMKVKATMSLKTKHRSLPMESRGATYPSQRSLVLVK